MYLFVIFSVFLSTCFAHPGNLGLGYGPGLALNAGIAAGNGISATQVTVASRSLSVRTVAAAPVVLAAPLATSSQSRVDVTHPSQVVSQVAAAIPTVPLQSVVVSGYGTAGLGGAAGLRGGAGIGGVAGLELGAATGYAGGATGGYGGHEY